MLPENRVYWIRGDDGLEYGPVGRDELREWVRENRAGLGTDVRGDEPAASWLPWQSYPELVAILAEVQGTNSGARAQVAGAMGRRILAFLLDLILSGILATPVLFDLALIFRPSWFIAFALASSDPRFPILPLTLQDELLASLVSNVILALYMTGFHATHGRTPAKSLLRLKVVDETGRKPRLLKSLLRAFMLIISLNLYGLPLTYAFFNPRRRAFHDFVAGTCVVEA